MTLPKNIPIVAPEDFVKTIESLGGFAQAPQRNDDDESFLKNATERPYNGQPWTAYGKRGQQLVTGLTMRDVGDCAVTAFNRARMRDPYAPIGSIDVDALGQEVVTLLEHLMGIFPNIEGR